MKMAKTLVMPVLVVAAVGSGIGTAAAQPGLPPLPAMPQPPALPQLPAPPQIPTADEVSGMIADRSWPDNPAKREAFQTMANEVNIGWANGGQQKMMIGSLVGAAIGCVSIFPNFMAGCMIGNVVGAGVGAAMGIDEGNPNARPAVEKFFATP
ncbi:hypothetical protein GCM10023094_09180 [Rhodococcus olei]|uniref:Glycine zipper family protein n=1 Tax=Rhodococcus olei TaxID=2161675 RepID=A0ABP8NXU4_9NOCA